MEQKKAKMLAKNDPLGHTIQHREICCNRLILKMVGERGFEPPTPWSRTRCSTRLSHSPNMGCGCVSMGRGLARFTP